MRGGDLTLFKTVDVCHLEFQGSSNGFTE